MNKGLIILLVMLFVAAAGSVIAATVNYPTGPSYNTKTNVKTSSPSDKYIKSNYKNTSSKPVAAPNVNLSSLSGQNSERAEIESLAMSILRDAESRKNNGVVDQAKLQKMMQKGVTAVCPPQISAKQTPTCPPVSINVNGRNLRGSLCAYTCYEYEGTQYDVGYCK